MKKTILFAFTCLISNIAFGQIKSTEIWLIDLGMADGKIKATNETRLTKDLSNYFSTNFVIDYEDLVWRSVGKNPILKNHFEILKSRKSLENW